jgi:hypothetical protein
MINCCKTTHITFVYGCYIGAVSRMYWPMEVVEGMAAKLMCWSEWVMRLRAIKLALCKGKAIKGIDPHAQMLSTSNLSRMEWTQNYTMGKANYKINDNLFDKQLFFIFIFIYFWIEKIYVIIVTRSNTSVITHKKNYSVIKWWYANNNCIFVKFVEFFINYSILRWLTFFGDSHFNNWCSLTDRIRSEEQCLVRQFVAFVSLE